MKKLLFLLLILTISIPLGAEYKVNPLLPANLDYYKDRYVATYPTNAGDSCTKGQYSVKSGNAAFCVATDTWEQVTIATWAITDVLLLDDGTSKLLLDDGSSYLLIR